ncbi:MAG: hypothetical protein J2P17_09585 [Mycobacterium sp.]|nr:hypothetical protein [Mycobacterium sp.]
MVAALAVAATVPAVVMAQASPFNNGPIRPAGAVAAASRVGHMAPARHVSARAVTKAFRPTKAQRLARARAMAGLAKHVAPAPSRHTTAASVQQFGGPATSSSGTRVAASSDFKLYKNGVINSNCAECGQATVNEPSVANSGKYVVETSNWNISYTTNGNTSPPTWQNLDPYVLSSGFCCDQEVTYDPEHDVFLLLQLDYAGEGASTNGFTVSVAPGRTPTAWCTYKFTGASFGEGATDTFDFPKIGTANNNAYVTWNDYPPNSGFAASGLARFPLDSLASCAGFGFNFLTRNTEFTFALSKSASSNVHVLLGVQLVPRWHDDRVEHAHLLLAGEQRHLLLGHARDQPVQR